MPDGALAHAADEILYNPVMHVGLEQRQAHLAHGGVDVALRELAAPAELLKYLV
jgi:hypothetical protein